MIKLLIADDEQIERRAVKMVLENNFAEMFDFLEAKNGRQAIEISDTQKPEIIIMDIKMPGINGIEAIKEIKKLLPESYFIILTAYDYFVYAKEAMECGIKDYLLKPLNREDLIAKVREALDYLKCLRNRRKEQLETKERFNILKPIVQNELCYIIMNGSFEGIDYESYLKFLGIKFEFGYAMIIGIKDKYGYADTDEIGRIELKRDIKDFIYDYLSMCGRCISTSLYTRDILIFAEVDYRDNFYKTKLECIELARTIASKVKERFNVSIVVGIGRVHKGVERLTISYNEAMVAINYEDVDMRVRHYDDVFNGQPAGGYYPFDYEKRLLNSIYREDYVESCEIFSSAMDRAYDENGDEIKTKNIAIQMILNIIISINESAENVVDIRIINDYVNDEESAILSAIKKWGQNVIHSIIDALSARHMDSQREIIKRSTDYIEKHYMEDVTLDKVANYVCISPYYFSKIFKKVAGESYIDYLTRIRIENAKEMLKTNMGNIKEICYNVGYNDPNYFSRVFKKVVGLSPTDFKEKFSC